LTIDEPAPAPAPAPSAPPVVLTEGPTEAGAQGVEAENADAAEETGEDKGVEGPDPPVGGGGGEGDAAPPEEPKGMWAGVPYKVLTSCAITGTETVGKGEFFRVEVTSGDEKYAILRRYRVFRGFMQDLGKVTTVPFPGKMSKSNRVEGVTKWFNSVVKKLMRTSGEDDGPEPKPNVLVRVLEDSRGGQFKKGDVARLREKSEGSWSATTLDGQWMGFLDNNQFTTLGKHHDDHWSRSLEHDTMLYKLMVFLEADGEAPLEEWTPVTY